MRKATTYRAARRNLILRGARLPWHPLVQFTPGGREYKREIVGGERGMPVRVKLTCVRVGKSAMHANFLKALLSAARIAEQRAVDANLFSTPAEERAYRRRTLGAEA